MLQALIFDVDGVLADTETAHRDAFNAAFAQAGLDWYWNEDEYTRLLNVAGGKERIIHYWNMIDPEEVRGSKVKPVIDAIHAIKTKHYEEKVGSGQLTLRPGIARLIREANAEGIPLAIATTTTPANVDALLRTPFGSDWRKYFKAVCDAGTISKKKPAPDVYLAALKGLGVPAHDCIAFEDSENGLRASTGAGIPTIVTPTAYTALHSFADAMLVLPHLGDPDTPISQRLPGADNRWVDLAALRRWHEGTLFEAS